MVETKNYAQVVSPFFRRLAAFAVDFTLLYGVGKLLLWIFKPLFFVIGNAGIWIGAVIVLSYFGILNSRIGKGQTLGKRLFSIKVLGKDGDYILPLKSVIRSAILFAPLLLKISWTPFHFSGKLFFSIVFFMVYFSMMTIPYLYIFNMKSRQSLHDLLTGTMVANAKDELKGLAIPSIHRAHYLYFAFILLVHVIKSFQTWSLQDPAMEPLYRDLKNMDNIISVTMKTEEEPVPEEYSHSSIAPLLERNTLYLYLSYQDTLRFYSADPQVDNVLSEHQSALAVFSDIVIYRVNRATLGYVSIEDSMDPYEIERKPRINY